jgi:DNA-binding NtrC family response regulator
MPPHLDDDLLVQALRALPPAQARLLRLLVDELPALSRSSAPLLVEGEPGCGRAALAMIVHGLLEPSAQPPLRRVRCAGPGALERLQHALAALEGEGAPAGSLLLEEVGHLTAPAQRFLLCWLEEHAGTPTPRLLSTATDLLQRRLERGEFRRDLYHRLAVLLLRVPALLPR